MSRDITTTWSCSEPTIHCMVGFSDVLLGTTGAGRGESAKEQKVEGQRVGGHCLRSMLTGGYFVPSTVQRSLKFATGSLGLEQANCFSLKAETLGSMHCCRQLANQAKKKRK